MKKIGMILFLVVLMTPLMQAKLPIWWEGAAVLQFEDPLALGIQGNVLFDLSETFQIRTTLVNINLLNGFSIGFGTRYGLNALLHFPGQGKLSLYGVGGFGFFTTEGYTSFNIEGGLGAEKAQSMDMKLFAEAIVSFASFTGGAKDDFSVALRVGVRIR